jgi:hypothetical protein
LFHVSRGLFIFGAAQLAGNQLATLAFLERRGTLRALDVSNNSGLAALAQLYALAPLKDVLQALNLSGCPLAEEVPGYRRAVAELLPALQVARVAIHAHFVECLPPFKESSVDVCS